MHPILETIYNILPVDKRQRNNGWIFFNCPSCYHTENPDSKHRGNIIFSDDSFAYQCFNCKFTCRFKLGGFLSKDVITWLKDLGASDKEINNLRSMVQEYNDSHSDSPSETKVVIKKREIRGLPENYKSIRESLVKGEKHPSLLKVMEYITQRNPRLLGWTDLMWAEGQYNFLIPNYEYGNVVGYSLRKLTDETDNKYIHFIPSGYIFNYDNLLKDRKYEIICEGQTDALAINGVSMLSNIFTPDRLKRILPFTKDKEIILLPDRDKSGRKMVKQVIDENLPFSVAFPNWIKGVKDAEEAVKKYGRLYTIYSILTSKESNKDLIKMKSMKWFS
jgi:5S rRNA maturation endonuclease (ribonuclease M5)